jgi:S1-C subfamily serine protease
MTKTVEDTMCAMLVLLATLGIAAQSGAQPATPSPAPIPIVAATPQSDLPRRYTLKIKVILVGTELSLKPVPKKVFTVCAIPDCTGAVSLTTSFQGEANVDLAPGTYKLSSNVPVEFEGKKYSWSMEIAATDGGTSTLELSNDNATVADSDVVKSLSQVVTDEGRLFQKVKGSVFKVESESGHGSGFLVDGRGLVLTNNHVIKGSSFLAVKTAETSRFPASLVVTDEINDIAILRVNPAAVAGLAALDLAKDSIDSPPVGIGEKVVAVGSPLTSENIITSGIVSKIEQGAIFSDVNINPGNSGGPLFDLTGKVIGINTFALSRGGSPGVSGIIRIYLAKALLEQAKQQMASAPVPPARRLPVESSYRFPPAILKEVAKNQHRDKREYHLKAGPMDVQFLTPVRIACLQAEHEQELAKAHGKRSKKGEEYKPGEDFYAWQRYAGDYRPVVTIQAVPEFGRTGGSTFMVIMFGPGVHQNFRFKTDFMRMELLRDGVLVEPLYPGRIPHEVDASIGNKSMTDMTYFGAYEYPPEAFKPGAKVELRIWDEKREKPRVEEISKVTVSLIWLDFAPYFEALQREVASPSHSSP